MFKITAEEKRRLLKRRSKSLAAKKPKDMKTFFNSLGLKEDKHYVWSYGNRKLGEIRVPNPTYGKKIKRALEKLEYEVEYNMYNMYLSWKLN